MGEERLSGPKKPLATELCAIRAKANLKHFERQGKKPLCADCSAKKHSICRSTGHVLCSFRKEIGWIPVPFTHEGCGLFQARPS